MNRAQALEFAAKRGFGSLCINGADGPLIAQVPFIRSDGALDFHLARANAVARKGDGEKAVFVVTGPDGYISPDWYGVDDMVPTWNYVSVEVRGTLELLPPEALRAHLVALSAAFEQRLLPKPVWTLDKVNDAALAKMLRMIVPARLRIETVNATIKLGQNKPELARLNAAQAVATSTLGAELAKLSGLMIDP